MEQYSREHVEKRLEHYRNSDWVSDTNRKLFFEFIEYLKADSDISNRRIIKYCTLYKSLFQNYIDYPLDETTKRDVRKSVAKIETSDYADRTKKDLKDAIRKFYNTYYEDERTRPEEVRLILNAKFLRSGTTFEDAYDKEPIHSSSDMFSYSLTRSYSPSAVRSPLDRARYCTFSASSNTV